MNFTFEQLFDEKLSDEAKTPGDEDGFVMQELLYRRRIEIEFHFHGLNDEN